MSSKRYQLTPDIQKSIVAFVRAGGFPHVAAEAAGIPAAVFDSWMEKGDRPRASARYRDFADAVRQAIAHARLTAETEARQEKPLDWLRNGPGRHTEASTGWTSPARASSESAPDFVLTPETQQFLSAILGILGGYPEAHAKVVALLAEKIPISALTRTHRRSSRP